MRRGVRRALVWGGALGAGLGLVAGGLFLEARYGRAETAAFFFPDETSGAVVLRDFGGAWARHWTARGVPPDGALAGLLERTGTLGRWREKHGETGASLRLTACRKITETVFANEAWLLFGRWQDPAGPADPGKPAAPGRAGLMLLVRTRDPLSQRAGAIAELILGEYKIERSEHHGTTIYRYVGKTQRKSVNFCQVGGWLCASLRSDDPSPLMAVIDRLGKAAPKPDAALTGAGGGALGAWFAPAPLADQLAAFLAATQPKVSKDQKRTLERLRKLGAGGGTIALEQSGGNIFNWKIALRGAAFIPPPKADTIPGGGVTAAIAPAPPGLVMQAQWSGRLQGAAAAFAAASGMGKDWDKFSTKREWTTLVALLDAAAAGGPDALRGMALYGQPGAPIPSVLAWRDAAPRALDGGNPAMFWAGEAEKQAANAPGADMAAWALGGASEMDATTPSSKPGPAQVAEQNSWIRARTQALAAEPPLLTACFELAPLKEYLQGYPALLGGKKTMEAFADAARTADLLEYLAGPGIGLGVAAVDGHYELTTILPASGTDKKP